MQSDAGEKFEEKEGRLFMSTQHVTRQKARKEKKQIWHGMMVFSNLPKRVLVGDREKRTSPRRGQLMRRNPNRAI